MDIGDGEQFAFIKRMIPDLTFRGSTAGSPSANLTVKTRNFPGGNYLHTTSSAVTKSASVPVEQFTDQVHLRFLTCQVTMASLLTYLLVALQNQNLMQLGQSCNLYQAIYLRSIR